MPPKTTARRARILGVFSAGAAAAALVAPAAASATTTCASASCIVNFESQRSGLSTSASFDTTVPTKDAIRVYKDGTLVATGVNPTMRLHHELSSPAVLTPNTAYTWHVTVTDAQGNTQERVGTTTTKHRNLLVYVQTITVTKDSDSGSAGEFRTDFKVGPTAVHSLMVPTSIESGTTVNATQFISLPDAPASTAVKTEMFDTDVSNPRLPWMDDWTYYGSHPFWTTGSSWAADWSTASTTLDTLTETKAYVPFQAQVDGPVGFVVRGQYLVSYS
ncbi:hypothetical protein CLV35_0576 [Motilibacter peucedani]|uniref:Ig-like domain-containing protein n=1 Tax=Motilibacter peucedani TaxID=598650 RepID=A0A420XTI8_9ACTN|nr:hypothetical protein [Motilibacter peucedani]RKS80155.1 hypothetical protein CLV35_0576 [Motilibacter peucedani]